MGIPKVPVRAMYFDQGQIPIIAVVNLATIPLWFDVQKLVNTLQQYINIYIAPVWGMSAKIAYYPSGIVPKKAWTMRFINSDSSVPGALAWHTLNRDGFPDLVIPVQTIKDAHDDIGICASHEIAETLVDPSCELGSFSNDGVRALEVADPVENQYFSLNGFNMTNFVFPSWFESWRKPLSTRFDLLGKVTRPLQLTSGGYISIFTSKGWKNVFGSLQAEKEFNRKMHRRFMLRSSRMEENTLSLKVG